MNRKFHFTKATIKSMTDYAQGQAMETAHEPVRLPAAPVCAALTDKGCVRPANQDALVISEELQLYGVADGMGGHRGGETASAGCRDAVLAALAGATPAREPLRKAVETANAALFRQQKEEEKLSGMGTTFSGLWRGEHEVHMAHVGDSRIYLMRDGTLQQMTDDHSLVGELVRKGILTPQQAEHHPMRNVITRAVGTEEGVEVDMAAEERRAGDLWLICSDGLYGMVPDSDMETILRENEPDKAAHLLLDAALKAGGRDNVSVIVLLDKEGIR